MQSQAHVKDLSLSSQEYYSVQPNDVGTLDFAKTVT